MYGEVTAIVMAREITRLRMEKPPRERQTRRPRRAAARVLTRVAVRLDPGVVARAGRTAAG
jgi:hypothetical protein